jgi:hypothetical protein
MDLPVFTVINAKKWCVNLHDWLYTQDSIFLPKTK